MGGTIRCVLLAQNLIPRAYGRAVSLFVVGLRRACPRARSNPCLKDCALIAHHALRDADIRRAITGKCSQL